MSKQDELMKLLSKLEHQSAGNVEDATLSERREPVTIEAAPGALRDATPVAVPSRGAYIREVYDAQRDIGTRIDTGSVRLRKLKPIHKKIIALHLAGWPNNDIARYLDVNATWVCIVLRDPLSREVIASMDELHEQEFTRLRVAANEALRDALQPSQSMRTRLQAASIYYKRDASMGEKGETAEDVMQRVLQHINAETVNIQVNVAGSN